MDQPRQQRGVGPGIVQAGVRPFAGDEVAVGVAADDAQVVDPGEPIEHPDGVGTEGGDVAQQPGLVGAIPSLEVVQDGVESLEVAVDVCEQCQFHASL